MSYIVLSRRYRPKSFNEIVGQKHVVTTLVNALQSDRVAHAYLFAGPRGVGKTSMARILSKALNCQKGTTDTPCNKCATCNSITNGNDIDVLEIDGASNRGIDEIRNIRQNVGYTPAVSKHKIYIIDEVHMLTKEAFNALLKTLEEPPEHVKFIFATTSPSRVPDTVQSRCQRFDFKNISIPDISDRLAQICKTENIAAEEEVLQSIAKYARGGLRDSESILDQLASFCHEKITLRDVYDIFGVVSEEKLSGLINSFTEKNPELSIEIFHGIMESGRDIEGFIDQLLLYIRDLLLVSVCKKQRDTIETVSGDLNLLRTQSSSFSPETLMYMFQVISEAKTKTRDLLQQKIYLEVLFVKLATMEDLRPLSSVLDKIEGMKKMFDGSAVNTGKAISISKVDVATPAKPEIQVKPSQDSVVFDKKASPDISLAETWNKAMIELQTKKKTTWALLKNARVLNIDDNEAIVEVPKNYLVHKERLEKPEEKRIIDGCLEKVTGKKIHVKFIVSKNGFKVVENKSSGHGVVQEGKSKKSDDIKNEPMVKKAIEFFDGSIVNVREEKG
ncbi:MAG: DNA polymerase III subunit gamma/tau [Candidatus Scalindua rubra]|uniref:DNA polymerase III subunit gamma/tau n=1 Tax=Candidatus Scalindua brodae TaxID=237368 RepID=A0A0B0EPW7_9BACT|nr:MAG: DNA polymerase III gamma/tau subunit [Candidatus Scalindua brodae]MBZ0109786.1 DNA polymerase III subunit gamma/tau [Candidatus Scalindua rubra]TWU32341.1 DNA polymerase III subunit tau [Candidatus Brocadiaceae bacterium S225]